MRIQNLAGWGLIAMVSCGGTPPPSPVAQAAPNAKPVEPQDADAPDPSTVEPPAAPPEPSAAEPWCGEQAHRLKVDRLETEHPLGDLIARTEIVAVASASLWKSDCSGIGHRHVAFTSGEPATTLYRRLSLHDPLPKKGAEFILVGGTSATPRDVSLGHVCIEWTAEVSGTVDWIFPLESAEDANAWRERLANGTCGRPGAAR